MASSRKLQSAEDKLRARQIGWEGYSRAGDITSEQLQRILKLSKQPKQSTDQIISQDLDGYLTLFIKLLSTINRMDALQWSLVMLGDMIIGKDEAQAQRVIQAAPWDALLRHLDSQDEFCQLKSATLVSLLLPSEPSPPSQVPNRLIRSLGALLRQSTDNQDVALQCLGEVLRIHSVRMLIWNNETSEKGKGQDNGSTGQVIGGLTDLLGSIVNAASPVSPQTQYQVAFCFWLLSFEQAIDEKIEAKFGIIPLLAGIARRAVKEKVVRVILSTFRNLINLAPTANKPALLMSSSGMLAFTQTLMQSKKFFGDEEVKEDTEWLRDYLKAASRELTTWDEYVAEVESKHLSWTPVHSDDEFWSSNAARLSKENGSATLKALLKLLDPAASSPQTLGIICSDLTMFIKYYEFGKRDIQKLGGKPKVIELLQHKDGDVRYKALVVVQLLVSQSWSVGA